MSLTNAINQWGFIGQGILTWMTKEKLKKHPNQPMYNAP